MGFNFYIRLMLYTYIGIYTYIRKVVVAISFIGDSSPIAL